VFDGRGAEYVCRFTGLQEERARLQIDDSLTQVVESPVSLTLAQAVAKAERFDLIVQKATELGVEAIVPLITEHCEVRLDAQRAARRLDRWRRISLEATKQCGRRRLVEMGRVQTLAECLETLSDEDGDATLLVFNERGGSSIDLAMQNCGRQVIAFIGPEGGWTDGEIESMSARGARMVGLGPRILRTETAAIVALALIQSRVGDLSR
jgi:16S rRNA (uracil1498-N3)-methyltransferase